MQCTIRIKFYIPQNMVLKQFFLRLKKMRSLGHESSLKSNVKGFLLNEMATTQLQDI